MSFKLSDGWVFNSSRINDKRVFWFIIDHLKFF
jgi:hypothetical protein